MKIFDKLFLSGYYFTIALRRKDKADIIENSGFSAEYTMKASRQHWAADPMLVDYGDKTYLFFEAVDGDKGHIAVSEVNEDCTVTAPITVLRDENHYSYPFVFCGNGEWYMIPETSSAREVRLYKAVAFPEKWELQQILLTGNYVDSTIFTDDRMHHYLLTFEIDGTTEAVHPRAFQLEMGGEQWVMAEIPWQDYDPLRVRGAGPIISKENLRIRPAQISKEHRYGDAVAFYSIDVHKAVYQEHLLSVLSSDQVSTEKAFMDGLHTYTASSKFEAIDVRCRDFDLWKTPQKLIRHFRK